MISVRIMSDCLRGLAGRDESHPAGSRALPLINSSVWWRKAQPGKLSPTEPQQPSPRLRCVGHTWRSLLALSGRKILFSPWLNGAVRPHVVCVVDARKDYRGSLIFGIPSRAKIVSDSKISICDSGFYQNYQLRFLTSPTQLILFQLGKRHTSCLCKCTILLKPWLCMKTSRLPPECSVLILTQNCLISICNTIFHASTSSDSVSVMKVNFEISRQWCIPGPHKRSAGTTTLFNAVT